MNKRLLQMILVPILCCNIALTNSKSSTLWRLNVDKTKIIEGNPFHKVISFQVNPPNYHFEEYADDVFNIIASTVHTSNEATLWTKRGFENYCVDCYYTTNKTGFLQTGLSNGADDEVLDCGKPVNFTYYDHLVGVINRNRHPSTPEPQAAWLFSKFKNVIKNDFDIDALEKRLKKSIREKPKSIHLYNQIGNFWRIKGDTQKAIECFRRALSVSPHSAEVLLNLARVLFNLQYLDDAIFLTRRSLEAQLPDKDTWQQHFTLGEIFKAYGHYQEATVHLRHVLDLNSDFEPALAALRDMEEAPSDKVHVYTLIIIICLVFGVLFVIFTSVEPLNEGDGQQMTTGAKMQRHFNKAMAMKTLRSFTGGKNCGAGKTRSKI